MTNDSASAPPAPAGGAPAGWQLVPEELTDDMWRAAAEAHEPHKDDYSAIYAAMLASAPPAPSTGEETDPLVAYLERQWAWSKETFGPALRTKGIVQHITKELREIEAEPHDLAEWVDVIILAMDGFWRHGGKPSDLLPAMQAKQDRNFARSWPDWRTMGEDQAIEHDRSGESASPSPVPGDAGDLAGLSERARNVAKRCHQRADMDEEISKDTLTEAAWVLEKLAAALTPAAPRPAGEDLAGQSAPALIAWLAHRRDECYASEVKFPAESPTSDWHRAKGDAFAEAHIYALARMKDAPRPAGEDLAGQGEPVAWVVWYDPALHGGENKPRKIIDASLAFMDTAKIGASLYAAPAPSRTAVTEAFPYTLQPGEGGTFLQAEAGQLFICADINTVRQVMGAIGAPSARDADRAAVKEATDHA